MTNWPDFEVPKSWRVIETREAAAVMKAGGTPNRKQANYWGGDIPFALIEDVTAAGLYLDHTNEQITRSGLDASSAWIVPPGAVLLSMYATIGATAINKIPLATNQAILAILPKEDVSAEFLVFSLRAHKAALSARNVQATQKNINKGIVETFPLPIPPLNEQRKIAGVLGVVQRAMEQQERLLALTAELKKTLLHQLFTQGLRGEPQKQTEIGSMPESWEVVTLENAALAFDYGTSVKCEYGKASLPVLRIPNVVGGSIDLSDLKYGQPKRSELEQLRLQGGDLLFVRTNGVLENAGRCALYRGELDGCYFASYLIRVRVDSSKVLPAFVNEYARTERGRSFLSGRAIRTADGKYNINSGTLKRVLLPLPNLDEQQEIVRQLDLVERKRKLHEAKRLALTALFHTLLHQLMTAQIRVHDLDFSMLDGTSLVSKIISEREATEP